MNVTGDSIFSDVLTSYRQQLFSPMFFCCMGYGLLYFICGVIAAIAVTGDRLFIKFMVVLLSTAWGLFCGMLAGFVVFSIVAAVYQTFPFSMRIWEAAVWGVGLVILMQIVSVIRRLYVYV